MAQSAQASAKEDRLPRVVQEDEQLVAVLEDAAADAQAVGPLYPLMATSL
jgi:hypothetical protein